MSKRVRFLSCVLVATGCAGTYSGTLTGTGGSDATTGTGGTSPTSTPSTASGKGGSAGSGPTTGTGGAGATTGTGGATIGTGGASATTGKGGSGGTTGKGGTTGSGGTTGKGGSGGTSATGGAGATTGAGGAGAVGGPTGQGSGSVFPPTNGVAFPWPVFDGSIPDTATATGTGKTWYADPKNGNDANDGKTFATAKKTFGGVWTGTKVAAGDTVLLGGGIYRGYPTWSNGPTGTASAPITIGSYGRGTGAPIFDGGVQSTSWTKSTTGGQSAVWQTSTAALTPISSSIPVLGIYVNNGTTESALKEVIHGQVSKYGSDPLPKNMTGADIKDNSNNWYFDPSAQVLYADFGGTLGTGNPNSADISILYRSHDSSLGTQLLVVLTSGHAYFHFIGVTIRASSWAGVYTETNGNTFNHCDVKFNGGAAFTMGPSDGSTTTATGNSVTNSRVWMNVLDNWPRFNNGNTGGGWPAALQFVAQSNGLIQGDVIYQNGGEGLDVSYTQGANALSTNNRIFNNVAFDNFSVNFYFNNTQGSTIEQNFVFQHPLDESQTFTGLFEASPGYAGDYAKRMTPNNLSLGDEPGASYDGAAHSSNLIVINNILAGGPQGFVDYDDGTTGVHHGLKNCTIENNTIINGDATVPWDIFAWDHLSDNDASANSIFEDNLLSVATSASRFIEVASTGGITADYNLYSGPGKWDNNGSLIAFGAWQTAHGWDAHSLNATAQLVDATEFSKTAAAQPVYDWSKAAPAAGSPALGGGTPLQVSTDFTGASRASGSHDIGALNAH